VQGLCADEARWAFSERRQSLQLHFEAFRTAGATVAVRELDLNPEFKKSKRTWPIEGERDGIKR